MKFIVETSNVSSETFIKKALTGRDHWFSPEVEISVTEFSQPPEVKKIETGILKFTPLINFVCCDLTDKSGLHISNFKLRTGDKMDLTKYPELRPYCDPSSIETTWDFSSIPDKALVDVVFSINTRAIGWITEKTETYFRINNYSKGAGLVIEKKEIKSIRIVELAKE